MADPEALSQIDGSRLALFANQGLDQLDVVLSLLPPVILTGPLKSVCRHPGQVVAHRQREMCGRYGKGPRSCCYRQALEAPGTDGVEAYATLRNLALQELHVRLVLVAYGRLTGEQGSVSPSRETPYIAYENAEVKYSDLVYGLRGVSVTIDRGEFVFFVGRTGAGKSTMLKLLTREVRNTSGRVFLQGRDLTQLREKDVPQLRREMGIVPQDYALLPRKKVWENVEYAMRAVGHSRQEVRRRVPQILERVSIGHRADAFPNQLSGGEQQRVAIGRALINNPPLLLADEPTGNLDPEHSWEIMDLLRQLNLKGTTVLVASHDMMVVERMNARIITMDHGRIVNDTGKPTVLDLGLPPEEPRSIPVESLIDDSELGHADPEEEELP